MVTRLLDKPWLGTEYLLYTVVGRIYDHHTWGIA